jgi:hypothetical protein
MLSRNWLITSYVEENYMLERMKHLRVSPRNIAFCGAVLLLISWSIDNIIRKDLDAASNALNMATSQFDRIHSESRLVLEIKSVERSITVLELSTAFTHKDQLSLPDKLLHPTIVFEYVSGQTELLPITEWRSLEEQRVIENLDISEDIKRQFREAVSDISALAQRIQSILDESRQFGEQLVESGINDSPVFSDDQIKERIMWWNSQSEEILEEYNRKEVLARLEKGLENAISEMKLKKDGLSKWGSYMKWIFFAISIIGTVAVIISQWSGQSLRGQHDA